MRGGSLDISQSLTIQIVGWSEVGASNLIQPRIYRAAFLPALLAVVIAAFSLEGPPPAAPQGLPADVLFDGSLASSTVNTILQDAPDRRAGRPGDERAANRVATTLRGLGYGTSHDRFTDDGVPLDNVIGRRPGLSEHELVVLANRDALSVPDATGSAADTAALIAVGRVFSGRAVHKTIVLASVDGGSRRMDPTRYGAIGRPVLRIISALDGARQPPPHGPRAYLTVGGQVMPGWALALLAATLILPALIASIDALARVRRRGHPVVRWFWWVAAGVVPFLAGLGAG